MALSLRRQAEAAEDDASALQRFVDEVPQRHADIASNMQWLIEVAGALRDVDRCLSEEFSHSNEVPRIIWVDVNLVLNSISQTHKCLDRVLFQQTLRTTWSGRPPYRLLWEDLENKFRREGCSMYARLEMYNTFLKTILDGVRRHRSDPDLMETLRRRLTQLLHHQDPIDMRSGDFYMIESAPWDYPVPRRIRPPMHHSSTYPAFALPAPFPPQYDAPVPPPVPEVISSPTFSDTSEYTWSSWSSGSPNGNGYQMHWATRIFTVSCPRTPLNDPGAPTRCYGRIDIRARDSLRADGFVEVLRYSFRDTSVHARFFWRDTDHRARILFSMRDEEGRTLHRCMPLTGLKLVRIGSRLQLNRLDPGEGGYQTWANLYFPAYEQLILFYSAFVALKRQDGGYRPSRRLDDFVPGEFLEYSGEIEDDNYLHLLRMWRDEDTGAVRLETSPRRGPMVGTPIWTAFITEWIGARHWLCRIAPTVIELETLRPFIFCHSYSPPQFAGRFRLSFTSRRDAEGFVHSFQGL
ncbi:hypothetical protein NA57DRAFT_77510 [Rhizodiscina lignyota]|uniref:Uncharacterized protein n=1 Tax=Rhizodiscina lignyota TaxID=1504668 RepID=A0A9P4M406_9PEZI|nr:hypothetical protein NA57DRAFT_77510 [Rhizodiscina lignyota]